MILRSYKDFVNNRWDALYYNNYNEMALTPTKYRNPDTGDFEDKEYHVSTTNPIYMDNYDMYYLYQFPPNYWSGALNQRYNEFLPNAKIAQQKGQEFSDIQDVTIDGVTFHNRNVFVNHLMDKIERAVDIDHFRNAKEQDRMGYQAKAAEHGKNKVDLGGYIGATLADPRHYDDGEKKIWASRGFMGVDKNTLDEMLGQWKKSSSEGWLGDVSKKETIKKGDTHFLTGTSLKRTQEKMKSLHAVPFEIASKDGKVFWPDVTTGDGEKPIDFSGRKGTAGKGEPLPILFPGTSIDSKSWHGHKAVKDGLNKLKSLSVEDLTNNNIDGDLERLELQLQSKAIPGPGAMSSKIERTKKRIAHLKNLKDMKQWLKTAHPGMPFDQKTIDEVWPEYEQVLNGKMQQYRDQSKKYSPYEWNWHKYNRETEPHDPIEVGESNPLYLGKKKYPGLGDKAISVGAFTPNNQSKEMIHAAPGEWEDHFEKRVGHNDNLQTHLTAQEVDVLKRHANEYIAKIQRKLMSDKDVVAYFGNDEHAAMNGVLELSSGEKKLKSDSPDLLQKAVAEIRLTNRKARELEQEVETGKPNVSYIEKGVKKSISNMEQGTEALKDAMTRSLAIIVTNAEKFVRRNAGHSAFRNYKDSINSRDVLKKHQSAIDLRNFVATKAEMYADTIAQLKFDDSPTRRKRQNAQSDVSYDVNAGEDGEGSQSSNVSDKDGQRHKNQRGDYEDDNNEKTAKTDAQLFGDRNLSKIQGRKYRAASDALSGTTGHSVESMYDLISQANLNADGAIQDFHSKLARLDPDAEVSTPEKIMLKQISTSMLFYKYYHAKALQDALANTPHGEEPDMKAVQKAASAETDKALIAGGYVDKNYSSANAVDDTDPVAVAKRFKERLDNDQPMNDDLEKRAALFIKGNEQKGLTNAQIQVALSNLELLTKQGKLNGNGNERFVDLVLMYYGRQPTAGSFDSNAIAATQIASPLPDTIKDMSEPEKIKMLKKQQAVQADVERLRQQRKAQAGQPPATPPVPGAPQANPTPGLTPPGQTPPAPIKKSPLGSFLRKPQ